MEEYQMDQETVLSKKVLQDYCIDDYSRYPSKVLSMSWMFLLLSIQLKIHEEEDGLQNARDDWMLSWMASQDVQSQDLEDDVQLDLKSCQDEVANLLLRMSQQIS